MVKKLPLIKNSFFYKIIAVVVFILFIYTLIIIFTTTSILNKTILNLEQKSGKAIVEKIVETVQDTNENLNLFKQYEIDSKKQEMKNFIDALSSFITQTINKAQNKEIAKKNILTIVSKIKYGTNYCFITDYSSKMIAHPYLANKDLSTLKDLNGKLIVPSIVKAARCSKDGGFDQYWWKKDKGDIKMHQKIVYAKDIPNLKWVLGTGVYMDDIEKIINKRKKLLYTRLKEIINKTKIGESGYIYIFNNKGYMLFHPNPNIANTDFKNLKNPATHKPLFQDLIKAAQTTHILRYKWDKPNDKGHYVYDKIAWVYYYPNLKWYIASSVYLSDLNKPINLIKKYIITTTILSLLAIIIVAYIVFKNMMMPIKQLADISKEVTNGDYNIKFNYESDDEIGVLAREFNKMIETLKNNIENLDEEVAKKTKELKEALNYAQLIFNNSAVGVMIVDKDRNIIDVNPSLCEMLKYSKKELIGKNTKMLHLDKTYYEKGGKLLFKPAQTSNISQSIFPLKRKDGEIIWVSVNGAPLINGSVVWSMSDYTQSYIDEQKIKNKNAQLESLLNFQDSIAFIVENNTITLYNNTMKNTFKKEMIEKISDNIKEFNNILLEYENAYKPKNENENWIEEILKIDEEKRIVAFSDKHGIVKIFKVNIKPFFTENKSYMVYLNDITDTVMQTKFLQEQANTDVLTGILNRRRMTQILEEEVRNSQTNNLTFSLIMLDIDFFKKINDQYGHDMGDRVLKQLSLLIQQRIRKEDTFARWGGEEFLILMPNTPLHLAVKKAESLRIDIFNANFEGIPKFSVSFGVSSYRIGESIEELLKRVDDALYKSKNTGRNKTSSIL